MGGCCCRWRFKVGLQKSVAFDQKDDHLESVSVHDCGFMTLRGEFAKEYADHIQLVSDPGLSLSVNAGHKVDPREVLELLDGDYEDQSSGIRENPWEVGFGGLALWMSLREPDLCFLSAEGKIADQGIVPCFMEYKGEWRRCWTIGILADGKLCVFTPPSDDGALMQESADQPVPELVVRTYGADARLSQRLINHVAAWDAAGRPSNQGLRIRAYPADTEHLRAANRFVISKEWSQLVLDWQQMA